MKILLVLMLGLTLGLGCARLRVEGSKEPIKVDISMRLDIYQHVKKDIDAIEDIVSGGKKENNASTDESLLNYFVTCAFAQEALSPEVEQAALRRRDRLARVIPWQQKGAVGEDRAGLLKIRDASGAGPEAEELVKLENEDRMIIYRALSQKNNTAVEEIQKIYAKRLQGDAPTGTPIEVLSESTGSYEWKIR